MASQSTAEVAAKADVGMPQLDFSTFPNQIFWLVVTLVAIYLILSRVALPRIGGVLSDRADAINSDLASADEYKAQAEQAEAAYQKALADARAQAQAIAAKARADIQAELDIEIAKTDAEIAAQRAESAKAIEALRKSASDSIEDIARGISNDIVVALGGDAAAPKTINSAIKSQMKE